MSATRWGWMRAALPAVLILGSGLLWAPPSPAAAQAPQTIATTNGPILTYAADGGRMAWITFRASRCDGVVHERVIRTGADVVLGRAVFGRRCAFDSVGITMAGSRALWSWFYWPCDCMTSFGRVVTAAPGRPSRVVESLHGFDFSTVGDSITAMAGDGRTLAYGRLTTDYLDFELGTIMIAQSRVKRVTAAGEHVVPNAGHPGSMSVNGTRIAVINVSDAGGTVRTPENDPVHVRDAVTGATIATITPTGFARAIALGTQRVALMVEKADGTRQLEIYDADSGVLVSSFPLAAEVDGGVDLDQGRAVYKRGNVIKLFADGRSRVLAISAGGPIGLSIEGRRVSWAENLNGRGRIRSVLISTQK
jgi:hypothetical protein